MTYTVAARTGGMERIMVECADQLCELGHDVHVFASHWQAGALHPAAHAHGVPVRPRPNALEVVQFRRRTTAMLAQADLPFDVHAAFTAHSPLGGVFWLPSIHRTAYATAQRRHSRPRAALSALNPTPRLWMHHERQMLSPGGYRHLVAATEELKGEAVDAYDVPPEDVTVLPFGYDPVQFDAGRRLERRAQARAELGYGDGDRVVVFVGNELERKGFDELLEAAARRGDPALHLLVVGRVDLSSRQARIASLGMDGRVRPVGSSTDVALQHAAADAFALPTHYEPWGLVIVEALGSGLPVLTSRLAGAAEAVEEGRTGVLLDDPSDVDEIARGLDVLLGDGTAAPEAISASVERYRWSAITRRYAEILGRFSD